MGEVSEPGHHPREEEVERPQAEEGEGVGSEDDERVLGDREDRGDGVDGKDEVGGREDDHDRGGDVVPGHMRFMPRKTMLRSGWTSSLEWRASLMPVATRSRPKR